MIQLENMGDGRLKFATKYPSTVEILQIDGKIFVHSERLTPKQSAVTPTNNNEVELKQAK